MPSFLKLLQFTHHGFPINFEFFKYCLQTVFVLITMYFHSMPKARASLASARFWSYVRTTVSSVFWLTFNQYFSFFLVSHSLGSKFCIIYLCTTGFQQGCQEFSMKKKKEPFNHYCWDNWIFTHKTVNLDTFPILCTKGNPKPITDLN